MKKIVFTIEGKPEMTDFDASFYTGGGHDVLALWIGSQIVDLGDGYKTDWPASGKDEEHLRWKLDFNKTYRITIEELR